MKVSREQAEENRRKVVDTAATLFRERGIDGIGIADLMKAAGLTHGGFYRQFRSKDDLVVAAVRHAFDTTGADLGKQIGDARGSPFETLVRHYVSGHHRDDLGGGCTLTALAADASRRDDPELRSLFGTIVAAYLDLLVSLVPGDDPARKRSAAVAALSEMVGAVVLSRVVPDPDLSGEILETVTRDLVDRNAAPSPGAPSQDAET